MKKEDEEKKKRIEQISKHLHPHDDEPDPTAWETTTSPKCYSLSVLVFVLCLS